mmetsp:Transcript_8767/g.15794  ORF Transcript_8767/g.15794 Transcript_8767/m.15794 type:complete len:315 (-) Transcript_8767:69-1013(-)
MQRQVSGSGNAAVSAKESSGSTQAALLKGRGELGNARVRFDTKLAKPSPGVGPRGEKAAITRIGMDVVRGDQQCKGLMVAGVDDDPRMRTPVAQLNKAEERSANRLEEKNLHYMHDIQPGDRIRGVSAEATQELNLEETISEMPKFERTMSATAMLAQLQEATSFTQPKGVKISVSRDLRDVMQPTGPRLLPPGAAASAPSQTPFAAPKQQPPPPVPAGAPELANPSKEVAVRRAAAARSASLSGLANSSRPSSCKAGGRATMEAPVQGSAVKGVRVLRDGGMPYESAPSGFGRSGNKPRGPPNMQMLKALGRG